VLWSLLEALLEPLVEALPEPPGLEAVEFRPPYPSSKKNIRQPLKPPMQRWLAIKYKVVGAYNLLGCQVRGVCITELSSHQKPNRKSTSVSQGTNYAASAETQKPLCPGEPGVRIEFNLYATSFFISSAPAEWFYNIVFV
jgi:hypothetical protein